MFSSRYRGLSVAHSQLGTKKPKPQLPWVVILALLLGLLPSCAGVAELANDAAAPAVRSGVPLTDMEGNDVYLADYTGQVVLLNFWATWCAPCRTEMPALDVYYQAHRDEGFMLLAVNAGEPAEQVAEFLAENSFSFHVILDRKGVLANQLGGIRAMPTSFLLDRAGRVVQTFVGVIQPETLASVVTPLLLQPVDPGSRHD
jgi:thiol-disulfide isomerase/thioredoxin